RRAFSGGLSDSGIAGRASAPLGEKGVKIPGVVDDNPRARLQIRGTVAPKPHLGQCACSETEILGCIRSAQPAMFVRMHSFPRNPVREPSRAVVRGMSLICLRCARFRRFRTARKLEISCEI